MQIISKNAYIVDHENNNIEFKDINNQDYKSYVTNLLNNINHSSSISEYQAQDDGTTHVLNQCSLLMSTCLEESLDEEKIKKHTKVIAGRFLDKEIIAQKKISRLNVKIKVGCLIIAVILNNDQYQLLIAKLDSLGGLELEYMTHADIIEDNEKKLGKSCLIDINICKGIPEFGKIQVLLDNKADYFANDFLELKPLFDDGDCTEKVVKSVLDLIDKELKKEHPRERQLLRNSFILHMRSNEFIDYTDATKKIFSEYFDNGSCDLPIEKKNRIEEKLAGLPEKKNFSKQFNRINDRVNVRLTKSEYKLSDEIELVIKEGKIDTTIFQTIIADEELDGRSFIKIYTNDEDTLKTFKITN